MTQTEQLKQAQIVSLRLLTASPKSSKEIARKLEEKGFDPSIVDQTLQLLEKQGLLNDRVYAENLSAKFRFQKPSGHKRIDFELKRHGVSAGIREQVLSQENPTEERERAREIAANRWERFSNLPLDKRTKRVYDFLLRRGFDFTLSRDLIEELRRQNSK